MDPACRLTANPARRTPLADAMSKANTLAVLSNMAKSSQVPTLTVEDCPIDQGHGPISTTKYPARLTTSKRDSASSHTATSLALNPIKTRIGPWQLGQTVGAGAVGKVRQVRHMITGQTAAAKIISKGTADKVCARSLANLVSRVGNGAYEMAGDFVLPLSLEREIVIMRLLGHQNIARIYDVWENCEEVYIILEYVNGCDLFSYLASMVSPLNEQYAVYLFRQLVEALLYCHRFQIYHRDLKPENIMLDTSNHTIKVIDFGMAAFQPTGNMLKTPCGSPHYAAPELLYGRPYDGSKADVWSLACVLFSMLTGGPPFNYPHNIPSEHKLNYLYGLIKAAQVKIPSSLSKEARDLFKRVFVADPKKRIDVFGMWRHPLLHKYDKLFGYEDQSIECYIGPNPTVEGWTPLTPEMIDQNIFRNLLMLWHDTDESALVTKLCNSEQNQEKYFYLALKKYQDDQLDALDTSPLRSRLVISNSDHHHAYGMLKRSNKRSPSRSTSKFSVFHEEHLESRHSFFDEPSSEASCDPFRSPNRPTIKPSNDIMHPSRQLQSSNGYRAAANDNSSLLRGSLRVEALKHQNSKRMSGLSRRSRVSAGNVSLGSRHSRSLSHASTASLQHHSPTPIIVSRRHRRNVSFNHKRQGASSVHHPSKVPIGVHRCDSPVLPVSSHPSNMNFASTPASLPGNVQLDKKAFLAPIPATPRTRTLKVIELEARKVSNELEKVCHEAFFCSSPSEKSYQSSQSDGTPLGGETPPSSISNTSSATRGQKAGKINQSILMRPLPPTPEEKPTSKAETETPGTYTTRELQAVRERLVHRYSKESPGNQRFYNDIVKQLDSLMPPKIHSEKLNIVSYPLSHDFLSSNDFLQAIPEEGHGQNSDDYVTISTGTPVSQNITIHDYARTETNGSSQEKEKLTTIRVVQPSSPAPPSPWAPLNIRKVSGAPTQSSMEEPNGTYNDPHMLSETYPDSSILKTQGSQLISSMKGPWWRRTSQVKESYRNRLVKNASTGCEWADLDDRVSRRDQRMATDSPVAIASLSEPSSSGELLQTPIKKDKESRFGRMSKMKIVQPSGFTSIVEPKRGFFKSWFQKKQNTVYDIERDVLVNHQGESRGEFDSRIATVVPEKKAPQEWNLLHRILRIKPESRVFVMCHSRLVARNVICHILLNEQSNGICDLARDPENENSFTGNLEKDNKWSLKPVSFALELFSILVNGKKSKITAVRFTQTRGSGPSLRKLVELLCSHLENGHLHEDTKETKEIVRLIQTGRVEAVNA